MRKPLPSDVDFQAIDVPAAMKMLADAGVTMPRRPVPTLDEVHAAIVDNCSPEDRQLAQQLVIVGRQDGMRLNQAIVYGLGKLRPDRDLSKGFNVITVRSKAIMTVGAGAIGLDLPDLDVAMSTRCGEDHIVVGDQDYRNLMAGLNEIVSGIEHGRSPKYD